MFTIVKEEIQWAGRTLSLETGKMARQADGSVVVRYGDTVVLCTLVSAKKPSENLNFFPLTVIYQEKAYAAGKIPGGFIKRETKPSDSEVLISRLIDRPMRPLFAEGFKHDTQVICTVLCYDQVNDPDIPVMIGASAAAMIAGVPFDGPMAGARVGYKHGAFILNPEVQNMDGTQLDLVVAGTKDGVLMVESEAQELSEAVMLDAVNFGFEGFQPVITMIQNFAKKAGKPKWARPEVAPEVAVLKQELSKKFAKAIDAAYTITEKQKRTEALMAIKDDAVALYQAPEKEAMLPHVTTVLGILEEDHVRGQLLKTRKRIDGRGLADVRPILADAGVLPRTHGSALFTRGETQAIVVCTLGTGQDEQMSDGIRGENREGFLLHYNFPPYSVGETGRMGAPGRREVGHGKLAWRALHPMIPNKAAFPYTIRLVSEITESNGSSSMATVCGGSLAMMDAGVPLQKPVAGIAMGLVKEGDDVAVLSDILGDEDHLGDMDFKVAGTQDGITALQMDLKITSITSSIMKQALEQAHQGRLHILGEMSKGLATARPDLSPFAPKLETFNVPKDKIGDIIGPGGKKIREIVETTGTKIDIDEDGLVKVAGVDPESTARAVEWIKSLVEVAEVGKIYTGKVVKIMDFGAFVAFLGNTQGLIHISEIEHRRLDKVTDVLKLGDEVTFKVVGIDDRGKLRLSRKACL